MVVHCAASNISIRLRVTLDSFQVLILYFAALLAFSFLIYSFFSSFFWARREERTRMKSTKSNPLLLIGEVCEKKPTKPEVAKARRRSACLRVYLAASLLARCLDAWLALVKIFASKPGGSLPSRARTENLEPRHSSGDRSYTANLRHSKLSSKLCFDVGSSPDGS